ncbi:MAG: outer-membrane lipoprotein carrier protein LolA [Rectinema sp.]|uniref:Outer membrane lipoprotein carrier protein LolA n=1 Tax=uncultured spirochete TaxID=156406 RepID=A0A3P3XUD4_9SPIR|nr:Outer membrane lipoprotein carrier protein LolA [uncultured spirochete]
MKRTKFAIIAWLVVGFASVAGAGAQTLLTADQFFARLADKYSTVSDYQADVQITAGHQPMTGSLIFKSPTLLRIDFSQPADQVIVFDGKTLLVYLPQYRAVLRQDAGDQGVSLGSATLASKEGLSLLRRNYTIGWEHSPNQEPLDPGSNEQVYRLMLSRKSVSEGYKNIRLSVSADTMLIRRLEGWTVSNDKIGFDFQNIRLNQGINEDKFGYDAPASANVYNNFLFQ